MASQAAKSAVKQVKPLLSMSKEEARRRAINLYRSWYREIPRMLRNYDVTLTRQDIHAKLREEFNKHKDITDIKVIDMLIIKGQMELMETSKMWKQKSHLMAYFKDTVEPKPTDFMSKFLQNA